MADIAAMLAGLPRGTRGPKTSRLADSLTQGLPEDACWPWLGRKGKNGYGIAVWPGERSRGTSAHRMVWELLNGPLDAGLTVDHICHDPAECALGNDCPHRSCVNPSHLAAVTARENTLRSNSASAVNSRKVVCSQGHAFTPENTYIDPHGHRACRTCQRAHWRRYAAEARGA